MRVSGHLPDALDAHRVALELESPALRLDVPAADKQVAGCCDELRIVVGPDDVEHSVAVRKRPAPCRLCSSDIMDTTSHISVR